MELNYNRLIIKEYDSSGKLVELYSGSIIKIYSDSFFCKYKKEIPQDVCPLVWDGRRNIKFFEGTFNFPKHVYANGNFLYFEEYTRDTYIELFQKTYGFDLG